MPDQVVHLHKDNIHVKHRHTHTRTDDRALQQGRVSEMLVGLRIDVMTGYFKVVSIALVRILPFTNRVAIKTPVSHQTAMRNNDVMFMLEFMV